MRRILVHMTNKFLTFLTKRDHVELFNELDVLCETVVSIDPREREEHIAEFARIMYGVNQ